MNRKSFIYSFFVLAFILVFIYLMKFSMNKDFQLISSQGLKSANIAYNSIFDTYKVAAQKDFEILVNNKDVIAVLKEFKNASLEKKKVLRGKLYRLLYKRYEQLKNSGLRQFHFHTFDGKSLLRFHNPYKNGDLLSDFRTSIKTVSESKKTSFGFEGGRVLPGFRYVFPIMEKGEYLGSVEFSLAFEAIEEKLQSALPSYAYILLMNEETTLKRVFESYKKYFSKSKLSPEYYLENQKISRITRNIENNPLIEELNLYIRSHPEFKINHKKQKNFSLALLKGVDGYGINFLALSNTENKFAGYIVSYSSLSDLVAVKSKYDLFIIIGCITILILAYLLFFAFNQRKRTLVQKRKIEENHKNLQTIMDHQKSIVVIYRDRKIVQVNKKFLELTGMEKLDYFNFRYNSLSEIFIDETMENSLEIVTFNIAIKNRDIELLDNKTVKIYSEKTKKEEVYLINCDLYKNEKGFILVLTNISDLLELQKIIQVQSKIAAVGEMIGNIAHQWRQPLSVITTSVTGLKLQTQINEDVPKKSILDCVDQVNSQAQYLSKTIDDFRDFFREDLDSFQNFNIKDLIFKVNELTKDILSSNYIKVDMDLDDVYVYHNESILLQALINIINNTKDAMKISNIQDDKRYLFIKLEKKDSIAHITIYDSAGGICNTIIDKIFEPYFTTKHQSIGTGIGLYMTHQIVTKQLKGNISVNNVDFVHNERALRGAEFKISLPV